jgi:hypothetical protein
MMRDRDIDPRMNIRSLHKISDPEVRAKNLAHIRRAARGWLWNIRQPAVPDPVFVIGCSRSGTTVTFETIASSGHFLHFPYEIPQFWDGLHGPLTNGWASEAASALDARPGHRRAALRFFYQHLGAGPVLDKTCINTMRAGFLHRLFPRAKFVFIHRDGRDTVSSMMDGWRHGRTDGAFGLEQFFGPSPQAVAINGGEFREWHFFLPPGWRAYNRAPLEQVCAFQWVSANALALAARESIPPSQWIQVRYEDLFERPQQMIGEIFDRLGVSLDEAARKRCAGVSGRPTSIVKGPPKKEKWKDRNHDAIERVLPLIRPMMRRLGYD